MNKLEFYEAIMRIQRRLRLSTILAFALPIASVPLVMLTSPEHLWLPVLIGVPFGLANVYFGFMLMAYNTCPWCGMLFFGKGITLTQKCCSNCGMPEKPNNSFKADGVPPRP